MKIMRTRRRLLTKLRRHRFIRELSTSMHDLWMSKMVDDLDPLGIKGRTFEDDEANYTITDICKTAADGVCVTVDKVYKKPSESLYMKVVFADDE